MNSDSDWDPMDPWVQWDNDEKTPIPDFVQRPIKKLFEMGFEYHDVPFYGTCLYTNILIPNYEGLVFQGDEEEVRTIGRRPYSQESMEYQFVWTQPDEEEAVENSLLKDRAWIFFSKFYDQYKVDVSLGLKPLEGEPFYEEGVKLILDVDHKERHAAVGRQIFTKTATVKTEGEWNDFYTTILLPNIQLYGDATGCNDSDSGHSTPDQSGSDMDSE